MEQSEPFKMRVDNQGCMEIGKTGTLNERTMHIDIKLHLVKDKVKDGTIVLEHISTAIMAADIFTKIAWNRKA